MKLIARIFTKSATWHNYVYSDCIHVLTSQYRPMFIERHCTLYPVRHPDVTSSRQESQEYKIVEVEKNSEYGRVYKSALSEEDKLFLHCSFDYGNILRGLLSYNLPLSYMHQSIATI